jgi:hypothetical protein
MHFDKMSPHKTQKKERYSEPLCAQPIHDQYTMPTKCKFLAQMNPSPRSVQFCLSHYWAFLVSSLVFLSSYPVIEKSINIAYMELNE